MDIKNVIIESNYLEAFNTRNKLSSAVASLVVTLPVDPTLAR